MDLLALDHQFFTVLNSLSGRWHWLDLCAIVCAKYLIFVIFGTAIGWWISLHKTKSSAAWPLEGKKKWLIFGHLSLATIFSFLLNQQAALIHFRERPFLQTGTHRLVNPLSEKSFPSDHAAVAFAIAVAIFFYNKSLGVFLLLLGILIGLGRIYTGVHYPLDILGGAVVGIFTAVIFYHVLKRK